MPLALVHDWLNQIGGAEDVLETLVGLFPGAPIYTSIYWREAMPAGYRQWPIRVSFMDRLLRVPGLKLASTPKIHWVAALSTFEISNVLVTCD